MDIGVEQPPYVVEPLVDPVPREADDPAGDPAQAPEPVAVPEPTEVRP